MKGYNTLTYEYTEQLYDISVRDRVESTEECVEDRHTSAEDHRRSVVHVNDDGQRCTCTSNKLFTNVEPN